MMNLRLSYFDNSHPKDRQEPSTPSSSAYFSNEIQILKINLGPVIGKVTHNTARILVEFNKAEEVTCFLQSPDKEMRSVTLTSRANIPIVFVFEDLNPKTHYKVGLSCPLPVTSSSFSTLREPNDNPGNLKVAIVSCNDISRQHEKSKTIDLWAHLGTQIKEQSLEYIFHIGDQVYMDMAINNKTKYLYGEFRKILETTPKDQWSHKRNEVLNLLRQQYYKTWNYPSEAYALANVPNLMIGDDHEFRDDWGWNPDDYTPGTLDHFYGECVRQLYYEYQRQLREDINWEDLASLKCEYYHEILNGVGISFMEYRGCRSWFREENLKETHIGAGQKKWIRDLYLEDGEFEQLNSAIFISPLPLFVLSKLVSKVAFYKVDDVQEYWSYKSIPQLVELLDLLRGFKERRTGRELLVVGGDIHMGGTTDIMYKGKKLFTQFVSSAINSKEVSSFEKGLMDLMMKMGKINSDYSCHHGKWKKRNNFGIVEVITNEQGSKIESKLELLKDKKK